LHRYRFGIEEEYFVVNRRTGAITYELPAAWLTAARRKLGEQVMPEVVQSQIEAATRPIATAQEARDELMRFRSTLAQLGNDYDVGILAAGTHPQASPAQHRTTQKRRYRKVIDDLGMVGLGNTVSGLHVHVEVPEPDLRVGIMHRLVPFLPILLALSTSSPFWDGYETGLLGYRNAANDALPRTGFPEMFRSLQEYEAYVRALVEARIVPDSTYVWWALRPSLQHPTLELRLTDSCTAVDDAVAIASLYRAMVRRVVRDRDINREYCAVSRALSEENRWRAQRYGIDGTYVDVGSREAKPFKVMLEETFDLLADDIAALGVESEIAHLRTILKRGTSAHLQLEFYRTLLKFGRPRRQAIGDVAKWLRASTEAGDFVAAESPVPRANTRRPTFVPAMSASAETTPARPRS
jgi:carboxylate-amine ligase